MELIRSMRSTRVIATLRSHVSVDVAWETAETVSHLESNLGVLLTIPRETMALTLTQYYHCRVTQARMLVTKAEIYQMLCAF